jgi:hypothetical protein
VSPFHEAQSGQFPDLAPIETGLKFEIELFQGLDPGKAGLPQPGFDAPLVASLPLDLQSPGEETLEIQLALRRLLADRIQLGFQMIHFQFFEQGHQLHDDASS